MSNRRKQDKRKRLSRATTSELAAVETRVDDLEAVEQMPFDPQERKALHDSRHSVLDRRFISTLSQREMDLFDRWPKLTGSKDNEEVRRIVGKYDDFILRTASSLGWQVFLNDTVISRISQWYLTEQNGPQLFEKLGKALALGARARRGLASLPIENREYREAKMQAKPELRSLLNRLRNFVALHNRTLSMIQICSFVREEIEQKPTYFPFLGQNLQSLLRFLQYLESSGAAMANRLAAGAGVGPAEFFDSWAAWSTNRKEEAFRQKISKSSL